jgi:alkaline phosphatase D
MSTAPVQLDRRQLVLAAGLAAAGVNAQAGSRPLVLTPAAERAQGPHLRIAFGSCAKQSKPQPIWATVRAARCRC